MKMRRKSGMGNGRPDPMFRLWGFGVTLESVNGAGDVTKQWTVSSPARHLFDVELLRDGLTTMHHRGHQIFAVPP